jgi:hypothetical protein
MKNEINWYVVTMVGILIVAFVGLLIHGVYGYITYKADPTEIQETTQKTLQYVGFDGKKHKCIIVWTSQHNWVLVENK